MHLRPVGPDRHPTGRLPCVCRLRGQELEQPLLVLLDAGNLVCLLLGFLLMPVQLFLVVLALLSAPLFLAGWFGVGGLA